MVRQSGDWKVTVARTSLDRLTYQMVFPYQSIYIMALGATATQLGAVNSVGMAVAGLFGPLTGWLIDRVGTKRIYLIGIGLLMLSYLLYGLAQNWLAAIPAMMAYWLGFSTSVLGCATICGNCLANKDRAQGMTFCETIAAGLLGWGTLLPSLTYAIGTQPCASPPQRPASERRPTRPTSGPMNPSLICLCVARRQATSPSPI